MLNISFTPSLTYSFPKLEVLNPRDMWADKDAYDEQANKLAAMFIKNFSKYNNMPENIINAGPKQMLD